MSIHNRFTSCGKPGVFLAIQAESDRSIHAASMLSLIKIPKRMLYSEHNALFWYLRRPTL